MEFADMYQEAIRCKYRNGDICMCEKFLRKFYKLEPIIEGPQRVGQLNVCSLEDRIIGGVV